MDVIHMRLRILTALARSGDVGLCRRQLRPLGTALSVSGAIQRSISSGHVRAEEGPMKNNRRLFITPKGMQHLDWLIAQRGR